MCLCVRELMLEIWQAQERWAALDCDTRLGVKCVYKHSPESSEEEGEQQHSAETARGNTLKLRLT